MTLAQGMTPSEANEWTSAAMYCAKRGTLPAMLSAAVMQEILDYPEAWESELRTARYALAMESRLTVA